VARLRPARVLLWLAVALGVAHLMLLAPQVPHPFCAQVVHVSDDLAFPLNCDSDHLMFLAEHPRVLVQRDDARQSRPVYVAAGVVLRQTLGRVVDALGGNPYGVASPAYLPLVALNLALLVAAMTVLDRLLGAPGLAFAGGLGLVALLAANDVVKAFFWSPHQQLFNVLVPLVSILACRAIVLQPRRSWPWLVGLGLGCGLGALAYGSFAVVPVAVALALAVCRAVGWPAWLAQAAVLGAAFALPNLLWIAAIHQHTGDYYNQEVELFREFVWIGDALRAGGPGELWTTWWSYTLLYLRATWHDVWFALLLLAAVLGLAAAARVPLRPLGRDHAATLVATGVSLAVTVVFYDLIGLYVGRLSYAITVHLLLAVGVLGAVVVPRLPRPAQLAANAALLLAAVAWLAGEVAKHGPYS
jgi:hypothetical protein